MLKLNKNEISEACMKIKRGFVLQQVSGSYVACATGKLTRQFSGVVRMNEVGAFIWKLLSANVTESQIVDKVVEAYNIEKEIAERDVSAFLASLRSEGILEE